MSLETETKSEKPTPKKLGYFLGALLACLLLIVLTVSVYLIRKKTPAVIKTATNVLDTTIVSAKPTKKQTVCLDPGHGGNDVGATYGTINESEINLTVATEIKTILVKQGYKVFLTRSKDTYVAKRDRAKYCNSVNATIMVAIHHNSFDTDHSVDYSTALYYKDSDQLLANSILNSTSSALNNKNQGISKFDDSLLWVATMPATLSEGFFITNTSDYQLLKQADSPLLKNEANGIATGIVNYFEHPDQIQSSINPDSLIIDRTDLGN